MERQPERKYRHKQQNEDPVSYKGGEWDAFFDDLISYHTRQADLDANEGLIDTRVNAYIDDGTKRRLLNGDRIWKAIDERMTQFGIVLTYEQRQLYQSVKVALAEYIYEHGGKGDFEFARDRIMKEFSLTTIPRVIMGLFPRQFGKTTLLATMSIALMFELPITICVFSVGRRQSANLMNMAVKYGYKLPGFAERIVAKNQEELQVAMTPRPKGKGIRSEAASDMSSKVAVSKLYAYPSSQDSVRGFSGNLLILDEFMFMDKQFFQKTVLPVAANAKTAMVAISSPDDEFNPMAHLFDAKYPDGTPVWHVIQGGTACNACREANKAAECIHRRAQPPWKSNKALRMVEAIMKATGDTDVFQREMEGLMVSKQVYILNRWMPECKKRWKEKPYSFNIPPGCIFTSIDPSAGGTLSSYAVASMTQQDGKDVVSNAMYNLIHWLELMGAVYSNPLARNGSCGIPGQLL